MRFPPLLGVAPPNGPAASRRPELQRRMSRAIAARHPWGEGRYGFTVRELCCTMCISAESLAKARKHPSRLSVNRVLALAMATGEDPLTVLVDL